MVSLADFADLNPGAPGELRVRGVLTAYSPTLEQVFLQDGESALIVEAKHVPAAASLELGQLVEVMGRGVGRWSGRRIEAKSIRGLERSDLPTALPLTGAEVFDLQHNGRRVELRGLVTEVQEQVHRLFLRLRVGRRQVGVYLVHYNWMDERLPRLKDSIVRVTGVLSMRMQSRTTVGGVTLIAANTDDLTVEQLVPKDPFVIEESPIEELLTMKKGEAPVRRVRIRGRFAQKEPGQLVLIEDGKDSIWAVFRGPQSVLVGDDVDVVGWLGVGDDGNRLEGAMGRLVGGLWPEGSEEPAPEAEKHTALTSIDALSDLPEPEAARGYPARVRGVVTFLDQGARRLFVQDGPAAILVRLDDMMAVSRPGELVEISGNSIAGKDASGLFARRIRKLGDGALPAPREVGAASLLNVRRHASYVSVEARVQSESVEQGTLRLEMVSQKGTRF